MPREASSTRLQRYSKEKRCKKETAQIELREIIQTNNQIISQHVCCFYICHQRGAANPKFVISIVQWLNPGNAVRNISLLPLSSAAFREYLIHFAIAPQACDAHRRGQAKLGDSGTTPGGRVPRWEAPAGA